MRKRLYFIRYRYGGDGVGEASRKVGVTKRVGYIWQERWNEDGYDGLIPKYAGGRPSKLSEREKEQLREILEEKDCWTTEEVRDLIFREFCIEYTLKQIRIILKSFDRIYEESSPQTTANIPLTAWILNPTLKSII
jgi:putative transposase